jgi:molybdate transport system regulatory protein
MPAKLARAPKPSSRAAASRAPRKPVLRFRMRITDGDVIAVGPGKVALLEAIEETGSITAAAKELDMSYRRAWLLIDELNRSLRVPAIDSAKGGQNGGGSALTDAGRHLIELYRRIEANAAAACRADIQQLMKMLAR